MPKPTSGDTIQKGEPSTTDVFDSIVDHLANQGWCVIDDALPRTVLNALLKECEELWQADEFEQAGVGRGDDLKIREAIRSDRVLWLDPNLTPEATSQYHQFLQSLRLEIRRHLYLPIDHWEGHFAIYPEGAFYKKHLDQHKNTSARLVTTILYLNDDWKTDDGGFLRLYLDQDCKEFTDIAPEIGRLVVFLADQFWHEVLPAKRNRRSITGWFRHGETPIPL